MKTVKVKSYKKKYKHVYSNLSLHEAVKIRRKLKKGDRKKSFITTRRASYPHGDYFWTVWVKK